MATLGTRPILQKTQTLKGLRDSQRPVATPSELRKTKHASYRQGFKANPGLELANAFGVKIKLISTRDCQLLIADGPFIMMYDEDDLEH